MIKHYFKVALRNLAKYKIQNIISILSIGVSAAIFSLVSPCMLIIGTDSLLKQDYVDNLAILSVTNIERTQEDLSSFNISGRQFKTVEKAFLPAAEKKSMTVSSDNFDPISANAAHVDNEFLHWCAYRSAVSDKLVENIGNNKVIISQNLGTKLFGDYKSAVGKQIKVQYADENNSDTRTFQIEDVIEQIPVNDSKLPGNVDIFYSEDFGARYKTTNAYLLIRPNNTLKDVVDEFASYFGVSASDIFVEKYRARHEKINFTTTLVSRAIIFFLYLFVIISLSSALRQWLQIFAMRQREMAIRKTLGSKKCHILGLFITEELISMALAFLLTILCCLLVVSFLENNFQEIINTMNFNRAQIFNFSSCCYLSMILICLIADWYAVMHIASNNSNPALQMKPKKHRLRNIGICIQIVICIIFLSITAVLALGFNRIERQLGIPSDKSRYENGLIIRADKMPESQIIQITEELKRTGSVESVINASTSGASIEYADSTRRYAKVYFQQGSEVVDFYGLNINYIDCHHPLPLLALVSREIKDKMTEIGEWDKEKIMIDGIQYTLAGWFEQMPFCGSPAVILTDPSKNNIDKCHFYIIPKEGMEHEAKQDIKELIVMIAPERLDAYPKSLSFELLDSYKAVAALSIIIYIILGISVINTVATIYAAISLDTRRRRKEMALRKINGAKAKDICRIFAKIYIIIMGISITIALPISWIIIVALNETFDFDASPFLTSVFSILMCAAAIFLTIYWKIKDVMNVDPVTYLKE